MADFILFNEGATEIASNGLPATVYFLLSTKSVDSTSPFAVTDTLTGNGDGEISGTGYARQSQSEPTPTNGVVSFTQESWSTSSATDWPSTVRSVVLVTSADDTGKMLCAWNLQTGGAARDMSAANTTENVTATLTLSD